MEKTCHIVASCLPVKPPRSSSLGEDVEKKKTVIRMFKKGHWFYSVNILRLKGIGVTRAHRRTPCRIAGKMLPAQWLGGNADELIAIAAETELLGGAIANVVRRYALYMVRSQVRQLDKTILKEALQKERMKS